MHFATALEHTVNVVVYGEFEAVLEIDKGRNIIYNCFGSLYSYARSHLCLLLRLSDSIDDSR